MARKPKQRTTEPRTQRAVAAALGCSRTKLKRLLADGLPARRQGDKLIVDIDVARLWIEAHEGAGRVLAPILDPRDPRHRERTAAAGIRQVEADLRRGVLVKIDDVDQRIQYELATLRQALLGIPSLFALPVSAEDIESTLAAAIEGALAELKADSPLEWPRPRIAGDIT